MITVHVIIFSKEEHAQSGVYQAASVEVYSSKVGCTTRVRELEHHGQRRGVDFEVQEDVAVRR